MNRNDQDHLWSEILAGERLEQVRAQTLARGVALQRRRRSRATLLPLGIVALIAAGAATLFLDGRSAPARPPVVRAGHAAPAVRMIDDAQLLADFADRPVALVGRPGRQRLIFLDTRPD